MTQPASRPVAATAVLQQLQWRYATKKFDPARKIAAADWRALEDALVLAPSSYGLQPWKFVVVDTPALRTELRAASWGQPQITDASHLVVFAAKAKVVSADVDRLVDATVRARGLQPAVLAGYRDMMLGFVNRPGFDSLAWATKQVYIALGQFLTAAAMLGIDACPMEGIDPAKYDQLLGLPEQGYRAVVVATAGYRAADDGYGMAAKVRYPHDATIAHA